MGHRTSLVLPPREDVAVSIEEKIEAALRERLGHPMSVAELVAAIPGGSRAEVWDACTRLREQGRLGRNGADTPSSPYRFYLKKRGDI